MVSGERWDLIVVVVAGDGDRGPWRGGDLSLRHHHEWDPVWDVRELRSDDEAGTLCGTLATLSPPPLSPCMCHTNYSIMRIRISHSAALPPPSRPSTQSAIKKILYSSFTSVRRFIKRSWFDSAKLPKILSFHKYILL